MRKHNRLEHKNMQNSRRILVLSAYLYACFEGTPTRLFQDLLAGKNLVGPSLWLSKNLHPRVRYPAVRGLLSSSLNTWWLTRWKSAKLMSSSLLIPPIKRSFPSPFDPPTSQIKKSEELECGLWLGRKPSENTKGHQNIHQGKSGYLAVMLSWFRPLIGARWVTDGWCTILWGL